MSRIMCLSVGDVMILDGGFWGWFLFMHCKVCERSRSGQSHNKGSSQRLMVLTAFKVPNKGIELWMYLQQGCFDGFANGIWEIVVSSINSLTLCSTTQCSQCRCAFRGLEMIPGLSRNRPRSVMSSEFAMSSCARPCDYSGRCSLWLVWRLNEIAQDPPLILWGFLEYSRASKSTKINHTCSNRKHKTRFQDIVYLKLNKWRAKILKNINKKNSTWCVKLMRKQEIIISLLHDKMSHRSWENWLCKNELITDFGVQKRNQNTTEFHSCMITAIIWENNKI